MQDFERNFIGEILKYCNSGGIKMEKTTGAAALYSDGGCCGTAKFWSTKYGYTVCASDNPLIINVRFTDAPTVRPYIVGRLVLVWCRQAACNRGPDCRGCDYRRLGVVSVVTSGVYEPKVTLKPMLMLAVALPTGSICGVMLKNWWSLPMKKLNPLGWKLSIQPNDEP